MNEIALALGLRPFAGRIDCRSWIPLELPGGAVLNWCAVCGLGFAAHLEAAEELEVAQ